MPVSLVILAAGQGTRMNSDLPKVLHPVAAAPLLHHAMQAAAVSGSTEAAAQAYDSLQSCLGRIPSGGTAGTRMIAEESCQRDEALRQSIAGNATSKSGGRAAAGAAGDSLEACMARIPKDGSVGQRMLAEESCKRDQTNQR